VVEVLGRAELPPVPIIMPAPKALAARAAASALVFCPTPLSTVLVGRSPVVALDALVRLRLAQGSILPRAGRTLAEGASPTVAMVCSGTATGSVVEVLGRAERPPVPMIMPASKALAARAAASALVFCATPLSTVLAGRSPWIALDALVRLRLAQGSILPRAGRTLAEGASPAVANGIATGPVVEVLGRAARPPVPMIMLAPGRMAARAAASALVFCATPLSTVLAGRSPWIALDALVRLRLAQGSILPRAGRTLAEGASPTVAMVCSGIATGPVVEVLGRAELPLVPIIMPAPKALAARAAASALVFCATPLSTVLVGRSPVVAPDALVRLRLAQGSMLPGAGRTLSEGAAVATGTATGSVVEVLGRAKRPPGPAIMPSPGRMAAKAANS